jgi:hypothetical protein
MLSPRLLSLTALCVLLGVPAARAQDPTPADDTPANLSYVEGVVDLVHEGVTERADAPLLLLEGDLLRTGNGRAEVVFGDGTLLHLDEAGELEVLSPTRVRLSHGRISLRISPAARAPYVIDTPGGSVALDARGEFGLVADRTGRLDVSAARGTAEIDDGTQRVVVRAGEQVTLAQPGARAAFRAFNSARWDSFERWAYDRSQGSAASPSASRLPYELRVYSSVLDHHGRWDYYEPYGYVWYPTVVVGWRPYFDGRWSHTRYGWTWYGRDRWAWPTHHYGRWGFNGVSWFWIPRAGWGPAWVSWGVAPGFVGWVPLGWDGGPAIGLWPRRDHPAYRPHDPWRGWTIVPRDRFGRRGDVRAAAIDGRLIDERTRGAMILQRNGPGAAGSAVPRGTLSVPGARGNARAIDSTGDRPGSVRRPPAAGTAGVVTTPGRRPTDAPVYAPDYTPDDGARYRVAGPGRDDRDGRTADNAGERRGGVRDRNPETRPGPVGDEPPAGARPVERARPRGGDAGVSRGADDGRRSGDGSGAGRGRGAGRGAVVGGGSGGARDGGGARPGAVRSAPRGGSPAAGTPSSSGARPRGSVSGSGARGAGAGRGSVGARPPAGGAGARGGSGAGARGGSGRSGAVRSPGRSGGSQ